MYAALGLIALALLFFLTIRPWYLRWGATAAEAQQAMPGDELVPEPKLAATRAITINAPVERVWPWLVQVGYGRAGWYNHDWINRLLGVADYYEGHRSSSRILPQFQDLKVGDLVPMAKGFGWTVQALEPQRLLIFLARIDFTTGNPFALTGPRPEKYLNSSQVILLEPADGRTARMVVRDRMDFAMGGLTWLNYVLEPGYFIQESAFMRGVKRRAERLHLKSPARP
ncbi:MAG: hypothetical protein QME79_05415 [Bacillota bacterium]|nr:hypothetical protein [Bacillota bacterium]